MVLVGTDCSGTEGSACTSVLGCLLLLLPAAMPRLENLTNSGVGRTVPVCVLPSSPILLHTGVTSGRSWMLALW